MKMDEAVLAVGLGCASGYIGGPGANENMALTQAVNTTIKTVTSMASRSNQVYA